MLKLPVVSYLLPDLSSSHGCGGKPMHLPIGSVYAYFAEAISVLTSSLAYDGEVTALDHRTTKILDTNAKIADPRGY